MKRPIAEIRREAGVPQRLAAAELGIAQSTWAISGFASARGPRGAEFHHDHSKIERRDNP